MCGIAGWQLAMGLHRDLSELEAMAGAIAHRGPDDHGFFVDAPAGIALAHRRLSIIDLSAAGHQPMQTDDGSVVLVFNGELYNYLSLKRELELRGRVFHSRSDTEVVLLALAEWGTEALGRFRGMFALAVWFARDRRLLLARDPLGMKPLYYTSRGMADGVAFASEIKAFLPLAHFGAEINRHSLQQYLEFGYVFDESETSLAGVMKVPPGHMVVIEDGRAGQVTQYFQPHVGEIRVDQSIDSMADALHATLSDVVREHLVADVPVGLLLSGGLDSSVLAAIAARDAKVATITMGFAESTIDERAFARQVAEHIGSEHREVLIHHREVVEHLDDVVWYFDDLFADWGTVSTRLLYKKCREQEIKVVLVGEGSDELFGGYSIFSAAQQGRGPVAWQLFQLYRRYAGRRYGRLFPEFAATMRRYLGQTRGSMFDAIRMFESRNQLPNNYVMKVDKASMAVGVEARAPYLDQRVAELAYSTPERYLLADGSDKLILRRMADRQRLLPSAITWRPKFGASIAASWMDESPEFRSYASSVVLARDGWVDRLGLRAAMTDFFAGRRNGYGFPHAISLFSNLAWRMLLLNLWSAKYLGTCERGQ
jgi:asparagine synthase (glutamine-hydrolysing)